MKALRFLAQIQKDIIKVSFLKSSPNDAIEVPWYPLVLKTSARLCNAFPIFWYSLGSAESGNGWGREGNRNKNPQG